MGLSPLRRQRQAILWYIAKPAWAIRTENEEKRKEGTSGSFLFMSGPPARGSRANAVRITAGAKSPVSFSDRLRRHKQVTASSLTFLAAPWSLLLQLSGRPHPGLGVSPAEDKAGLSSSPNTAGSSGPASVPRLYSKNKTKSYLEGCMRAVA